MDCRYPGRFLCSPGGKAIFPLDAGFRCSREKRAAEGDGAQVSEWSGGRALNSYGIVMSLRRMGAVPEEEEGRLVL